MARKRLKWSKKGKRIILLFCVLIIFVAVFICIFVFKDRSLNETSNDKEIETEEKESEKLEKKVQIIDLESDSRNIAVMFNNIKNVWGYQSGLQDAYIIYEMIVEGGYTRLMAIYKDKETTRIGSVRSARPYYLDYVMEHDAIYVHFGGSDQSLAEIPSLNIENINFLTSSGYWRDKSLNLAMEHTAYTSMEKINEQISKKKYRTTTSEDSVLDYSAEVIDLSGIKDSKQANKVYIKYSGVRNTSFEYDSDMQVYKRFQNGTSHIDYVTDKQYMAKNIITYQVENYSLDSYGRQALKNLGSGTGYYISCGYAVPITWEKMSRDSKTVYKYMDGTELIVNDGNTHIEIQPKNQTLTIE